MHGMNIKVKTVDNDYVKPDHENKYLCYFAHYRCSLLMARRLFSPVPLEILNTRIYLSNLKYRNLLKKNIGNVRIT